MMLKISWCEKKVKKVLHAKKNNVPLQSQFERNSNETQE